MGECAFALPPTTERASGIKMDWFTLVIVILNAVVSVLTNISTNQKRFQSRSTD
ncbi:MAG: hypothetical protein [Arizlama microvirus]|nr:MAG: hypothetical protein [Arizlama microvirus]